MYGLFVAWPNWSTTLGAKKFFFFACGALNFHALNERIQGSMYIHLFYIFYATAEVVVDARGCFCCRCRRVANCARSEEIFLLCLRRTQFSCAQRAHSS